MRVFSTSVLVVCVWMVARAGSTQDRPPLLVDSIHSSTARFAVQRAVWAAVQRLACLQCEKVLSDFRDAGGSHNSGETRPARRNAWALSHTGHLS
jgi:hypothetical protein